LASLQVTIVVSQLLSAPLRDHYAVLLLLPVAWLVGRGHRWAALIPLIGWISLFRRRHSLHWLATASVPLTFFGVLCGGALGKRSGERREAVGRQWRTPESALTTSAWPISWLMPKLGARVDLTKSFYSPHEVAAIADVHPLHDLNYIASGRL